MFSSISDTDMVGSLYDESFVFLTEDDESAGDGQFCIQYSLEKDSVVYLKAWPYNGVYGEYGFSILAWKIWM